MSNERNDRGNVGKSSAGDRLRLAHKKFLAEGNKAPLKSFARDAIKNGNDVLKKDAQDWFECKAGALNAGRSQAAEKRLTEEKLAKKAAKSKKK